MGMAAPTYWTADMVDAVDPRLVVGGLGRVGALRLVQHAAEHHDAVGRRFERHIVVGTRSRRIGRVEIGPGRYRRGCGRPWDLNLHAGYQASRSPVSSRFLVDVFHLFSGQRPINFVQRVFLTADPVTGARSTPNPSYGKVLPRQPPMSVRLGVEFTR
jgi:hypothetical protein